MNEEYIKINNKSLFYKYTGNGPLVIFLHGFAEDSNVWFNQFNALENFRCVFPDLPGSCNSEIHEDMSIEGLANIIYLLIQFINRETKGQNHNVTLIGHSMGGYVALAFAEKYSGIMQGLGLFHSTSFSDTDEKKLIRKKSIHFIKMNGSEAFLRTSTPNLYSEQTKRRKPELIEKQIIASRNFSADTLVYYYQSMINRPNRTLILKNSNIPILFIVGKNDISVPLNDSLKQCHLPEFAYIYMLDQSAHMGQQEQPEESNRILSEYLNSIYHLTQ